MEVESADDVQRPVLTGVGLIRPKKPQPLDLKGMVKQIRQVNSRDILSTAGGVLLADAACGVDMQVLLPVHFGKPAGRAATFIPRKRTS